VGLDVTCLPTGDTQDRLLPEAVARAEVVGLGKCLITPFHLGADDWRNRWTRRWCGVQLSTY